tara:strand:- start:105 stop:413 length:309 start_codon:yes stop_codon:yes gene_type:complete
LSFFRFGPRRVLFYRENDKMLCVGFPLGATPTGQAALSARLYLPIHECMNMERGWQQANMVGMAREEAYSKAYYKAEKKIGEDEMWRMGVEDKFMREMDEYR